MHTAEITQRRLYNQGLASFRFTDPVDIVRQMGAVQSQDDAGAKWGLGQRLQDASDAALDEAFNNGSLLRTHLLRPTWHFVTPDDIRWLLELTAPRIHTANASMYRKLEVDKPLLNKSYKTIEKNTAWSESHARRTRFCTDTGSRQCRGLAADVHCDVR